MHELGKHDPAEAGWLVARAAMAAVESDERTQAPTIMGATVIGLRCCDGVILAADTSLARSFRKYVGVSRFLPLRESDCVIGFSGDFADSQQLASYLEDITVADREARVPPKSAPQIASFLARVLYNRRCKMDPLWNEIIIAGTRKRPCKSAAEAAAGRDARTADKGAGGSGLSQEGTDCDEVMATPPSKDDFFMGSVNLKGTHFSDDTMASGFGKFYALPILRAAYRDDITVAEGRTLLEECMRVVYAREKAAFRMVQFTTVDASGAITVSEAVELQPRWDLRGISRPTLTDPPFGVVW